MPSETKARVGRPRAEDARGIEKRILVRAWALFLEGGYGALTHDALARLERMSKQTIYARFPGKAALFRATARERLLAWRSENRVPADSRFADPVAAFIDLSLRATLTRDAAAMIRLLREEAVEMSDLRDLAWTQVQLAEERLTALLDPLPGRRTDLDVPLAARAVLDLVMGHAFRQFGRLPEGEALEAHVVEWTPRLLALANHMIGRPATTGVS
jgi:TetR/AcrR family transcriptional regulator, mexJK operon transcriptional repressor